MEMNDLIHGFRVLKKTHIPEIVSDAYEFCHEKSGARLLFVENKDDNKVFSIAFRTPPADDTGVAHIVEHSVLCGSRKYPLKEPFVELVKGSLNTFLNAMTFPDKTLYPIASRNDKDFQNLMDVYLDAVFYPSFYNDEDVLRQEGWHYEIGNADESLAYSGVVYNEMKGALSSPDDLLEVEIMKSLYPDTTYAKESGGNPLNIPELTQERFTEFHRRYYHPSNSYIFLYGDMNIEEKLKYLDEEYLSHFEAIEVDSEIARQKPFAKMKRVVKKYPVGADETTEGKTFLSLNMVCGDSTDSKRMLAITILVHALFLTEAAPIRQAVIDAGIGREVTASAENSVCQPCLSVVAQNAEPEQLDKFCEVIETAVKKLVDEGIDKELLQASLNVTEFKFREADFGQYPKGLIYNISIMNTWLYDADPTINFFYEDLLRELQEGLDKGYFEQLLKEVFLDNQHKTLLALVPDTEMAAEREKKQQDILAAKKSAMTKEEIEGIIRTTAELKARQQREDSPEALATIPLLKISDIKKEPENLPLDVREEYGTKVLFSDIETGGIAYFTFYFDASKVPQEKLQYAFLLTELIGAVDTEKMPYTEISKQMNLNTGGIVYDLVPITKKGEPDYCEPRFTVKAKVLVRKLPELMELLREILTGSIFDNEKRLGELIAQCRAASELSVMRKSHAIMNDRLLSYFTPAGQYAEQGGLEYYWFIRRLNDNFAECREKIAAELKALLPVIFNADELITGVAAAERDYGKVVSALKILLDSLPKKKLEKAEYKWDLRAKNEALSTSSQVQYVGKGANFIKLGYKYTGVMRILDTIMRYDYLWTKIRVQGGAYGAFTSFSNVGNLTFGSYRDPNLKETLSVFDATADYLRKFDASEREMTKYIIGTMSTADMPLTPKMRGERAAEAYLRGVSYEDRKRVRNEILTATPKDIRALADTVDACMKENNVCVFGNEVKIKENTELFGDIVNVFG